MKFLIGIFFAFCALQDVAQDVAWFPSKDGMITEWGMKVTPSNYPKAYPRPTMVRKDWKNLNGIWQFSIENNDSLRPKKYDRQIMVPFAPESAISGVGIPIKQDQKIWYRRKFAIPEDWSFRYILLHFGAVDWEATIYINGKKAGTHRGGYDPFSLDITFYLKEKGMQEIEIEVWDPTDTYHQPRGKQVQDPKGIWYTSNSGIWQTVWIEPVMWASVKDLHIVSDIDSSKVIIEAETFQANEGDSLKCQIFDGSKLISEQTHLINTVFNFHIDNIKLWSPDDPFLYNLNIELIRNEIVIDQASSYFGMRKIEVKNGPGGYKRIFLNNKPIFQMGLLDQGWWPDGLYTAPSDEALKYDIQASKDLGYNLIRKHVKVEPERWYYHCDKIGMLVWQDMPNGDKSADWKPPNGMDGVEIERSFRSESQYRIEFEALIKCRSHHPSIIMWVPFNEGWGQFKTEEITNWVKGLDSTRLVAGPSGGNFFPIGDTRDFHHYPTPILPNSDSDRALVLSEYGGLAFPVKDHIWNKYEQWGYSTMESSKQLNKTYLEYLSQLKPLIRKGLCAAIYTQTTDVESEINGVLTYDRKITKLKTNKVHPAHRSLIETFEK